MDRRLFIANSAKLLGLGFGASAIGSFVPGMGHLFAAETSTTSGGGKIGLHHAPKAKSVIWLHQNGAPSTIDLFDYKPKLIRMAGQKVPDSYIAGLSTSTQGGVNELFVDRSRSWKQYGDSGAWFSDLLPNLSAHADKLAFIKSSITVGATHDISVLKLNTGDINPGRPSLGAWISYALGTRNASLPSYIMLHNRKLPPSGGAINWGSGFLPAMYQGIPFRSGASPIMFLERPDLISEARNRLAIERLQSIDQQLLKSRPFQTEIEARIKAYELAQLMQSSAPEAVDIGKESLLTQKSYGMDDPVSSSYGSTLLRARRLVERGVRFVHVVSGSPDNETDILDWDAHHNLHENHKLMSRMVDKPIAGLLQDLSTRGLLESTVVVWTSEFGRTSWGESGSGRDHNPWGYTQWMAGGGVSGGASYGETDDLGIRVLDMSSAVDTYDIHATVLHLLGLDHKKIIYQNNGRAERPTVVHGRIINEILS